MKKTINADEFVYQFRKTRMDDLYHESFSNEALDILFAYIEKVYHKDYTLDVHQIEKNFEEKNLKELKAEFEYKGDDSDGEIETFLAEQTEFIGMTGRGYKYNSGMSREQTYVFRSLTYVNDYLRGRK